MESNQNSKLSSTLSYIFDIKSWISPYIEDIHQHTVPHVFLFRKNADLKAEMLYKHWALDDWQLFDKMILKV